MPRRASRHVRFGAVVVAALALAVTAPPRAQVLKTARTMPPVGIAGKGTLIVGTYPNQYWIIDEASEKVVGKIPFTSGIPRRTTLSHDRRRFYVIEAAMEKVEIVDIAGQRTLDTFTLSEGSRRVRIRSLEADPLDHFVVMLTSAAEKQIDRFAIGAPTLVQYDLASHKIVRTIPWPNDEERQNVQLQFSPDGKLMYLFSNQDVVIYDTSTFEKVDIWELSKPIEEGFGRLEFGSSDATNDEPGYYTSLFNVMDPVQRRRMMGIGRVNLAAKKVDFYTVGPFTPLSFALAPGRKVAYGLYSEIGRYEFWKFDLETHRLAARTEFNGRPRMSLKTSSNGRVLYIYNAGNTIDLWDAETFRYLRTITLDGDMTSELFVFASNPTTKPTGR